MSDTFKALLLNQTEGKVTASLETLGAERLPPGDVTVDVEYSSFNYKDGLVLKGLGKLVRKYPHIPGIDLAGTVAASDHPAYRPGDKVVLTGWRVGELHWGGFAQKARVKSEWLLPLPAPLTTRQAMAMGTAGIAAMQAVMALEEHGSASDKGNVLVTGAAGGVGSLAVMILARLGYNVTAVTGRPEQHERLKALGASEFLDRAALATPTDKPLEPERWSGCVETVGGVTLARALAQTKYRCAVAAVGNAGGIKLDTTVFPFILRGVSLIGIDSAMCPVERRKQVWARLVADMPLDKLEAITTTATLDELPRLADEILSGHIAGRVVISTR